MLGAPVGALTVCGHQGFEVAMVLPIAPPNGTLSPPPMPASRIFDRRVVRRSIVAIAPARRLHGGSGRAELGVLPLRVLRERSGRAGQPALAPLEHSREIG